MARYKMDGGVVVDTANASATWKESTWCDGRNNFSRATGSQWEHQRLYRSRRGRYYLVSWSDWSGEMSSAEWVSEREAARWLLAVAELSVEELPEDLREHAAELLD